MSDSTQRSVVKAISWRIVGSSSAVIIAWVITGSVAMASAIGIVHLVTNTVLYFFHERIWNMIRWGTRS